MKNNLTKVAFVYIQRNNKILLLQEGGVLAKGLWCFPGGHVEKGETFKQGAIREAREESGYQITLEKIIYRTLISKTKYKGARGDTEKVRLVIFKGNIISGKLKQDNQALDLKWLAKEKAIKLPLRWNFLKKLILAN
jgi:8-oxo-dGTP diphosphatase